MTLSFMRAVDSALRWPLKRREHVVAGYSGTPLAKKLGLKPGLKAFLDGAPPTVVSELKRALADVTLVRSLEPELDFMLGFWRSKSALTKDFLLWKRHLAKSGCLWVAWPKKASGTETDLTGNVVRAVGLKAALVDIKVCAIDDQWSGLKFVHRKGD
jgi:hypothetical protein